LYANSRSIQGKIQGFEGEFFELPEKKMEFSRLKNIQDLNEKYFTLLTEKKVLYSISDAGYASNNRILSRPAVNNTPVSPNRKLIYVTFVFFGIVIGLGIMFFKYLTFNEINMLDDLKKLLPSRASILGGVPLFKSEMEFSQLVVHDSPKSMLAESMRKIRTNLSYIHPDYKTIAISSSISGEGKTFVALNLAGIIAMSGKKTILLDLDLRKPKVHLGLNTNNNFGMSGLIINKFTLEQCIQHSTIENLDFITAGPIPPNPSELLLSDRFKEIVEELKQTYDVIIIDNPPIGLVSDGIKNLTEADIPIYVFKSHYSKRNFAYRVKELFEMQQLNQLNVILNGVQTSKRSSAYGYGYGYNYGYGYYEGDSEIEKGNLLKRVWSFVRRKFKR
jgi:capsular exopolysaccharide synthesis family protein